MLPTLEMWKEGKKHGADGRRASMLGVCMVFAVFLNLQNEDPEFSHQYIVCWWVWLAVILREANSDLFLNSWLTGSLGAKRVQRIP